MVTLVNADPKAPFSIATTSRCREGWYSVPWIAPLYPWSLHYSDEAKQGGIKNHFLSLWYESTWDWPLVSRTIVNTLLIRPVNRYVCWIYWLYYQIMIYIYIYIYIYTLKWIGPIDNLILGYLFFFNTCFLRFKSSSGSRWFVFLFPLFFAFFF